MKFFENKDILGDNQYVKVYKIDDRKIMPAQEHVHEYMQIWYVLEGEVIHYIEGAKYVLKKNQFLVVPPKISHHTETNVGETRVIGCDVVVDFLDDAMMNSENLLLAAYSETFYSAIRKTKAQYKPSAQCLGIIDTIMHNSLKVYEKKEEFYDIELKSEILKLLVIFARDYNKNNVDAKNKGMYYDDVMQVKKYIDINYDKKITLEFAANMANMSQSYFSFFFKEVVGQSLISYVNKIRIERAAEMLRTTENSLQDICYSVGFNDFVYFTKLFKRAHGISPAKYRQNKD